MYVTTAKNAIVAYRKQPQLVQRYHNVPPLTLLPTKPEDAIKVITSLKTKTAYGVDFIFSKLL